MSGTSAALPDGPRTLGRYIAPRLVEVGVRGVFTVLGDFNLILLDHLLAEPDLELVGCCKELNAGYAGRVCARQRRYFHSGGFERDQRHRRRVQRESSRYLHCGWAELQRLRRQPHPSSHNRRDRLQSRASVFPTSHFRPGGDTIFGRCA